MAKGNVKATRDFQSAHVGGRAKGERFDYDMDKDPAKLKRDGFVELADAESDAGGDAGAAGGSGGGTRNRK